MCSLEACIDMTVIPHIPTPVELRISKTSLENQLQKGTGQKSVCSILLEVSITLYVTLLGVGWHHL
jgi:hypothetical protein